VPLHWSGRQQTIYCVGLPWNFLLTQDVTCLAKPGPAEVPDGPDGVPSAGVTGVGVLWGIITKVDLGKQSKDTAAWCQHSSRMRTQCDLPRKGISWCSMPGRLLTGVPSSARMRDVIDVGYDLRVKRCQDMGLRRLECCGP
jgi:hypothetical protein